LQSTAAAIAKIVNKPTNNYNRRAVISGGMVSGGGTLSVTPRGETNRQNESIFDKHSVLGKHFNIIN
jgi:hypothetical protein